MIDTHGHFWDPDRLPYPWLVEVPSVAGKHIPADLHAEAGASLPAQIVFVQAGCARPLEEVEWIEALARDEKRITAIVAFTPVDRGATTVAALERLRQRPLLRGIRHLIQGEPDPDFCLRPAFVAGVREVGNMGLSFDICIRHHQLPAVAKLVAQCPGTAFVLNHAGKPDVRNGRLDPWRADLHALAALPNVSCKLSGLIAEADPTSWTPESLRPYVDAVLEAFGPERVAFGSDWPVVKIGSTFLGWLRTAQELLGHLPAAARRAVFSENARRIYRLPADVPS